MMTENEAKPGLALNGLDGSNPLGFLAATGTLRVVSKADPSIDWRMSWTQERGYWSPLLAGRTSFSEEGLIQLLMLALKQMKDNPAISFSEDLTISCEDFRYVAQDAQHKATMTDRCYADFIAAFGCDGLFISEKNSNIQDTAFRTMSGAGHQHFIGSMRDLVNNTKSTDLHASLFDFWSYKDSKPSLRWDPIDDRRYALRWNEPSGDPIRTMRGANRLAIEALPLFPTAPGKNKRLDTTGFSQLSGRDVFLSWPIWESPITVDVVRSLLSLDELQSLQPDHKSLSAKGVVEIFRSQRITTGKYRNFTPAAPV